MPFINVPSVHKCYYVYFSSIVVLTIVVLNWNLSVIFFDVVVHVVYTLLV